MPHWLWWCTPVSPALILQWKQEDQKFEASLDYTSQKQTNKTKPQKTKNVAAAKLRIFQRKLINTTWIGLDSFLKFSWAWQHTPDIPDTCEDEAGSARVVSEQTNAP